MRTLNLDAGQTWAEAGFGFTKPAFLGSRLRLLKLRRLQLRPMSDAGVKTGENKDLLMGGGHQL